MSDETRGAGLPSAEEVAAQAVRHADHGADGDTTGRCVMCRRAVSDYANVAFRWSHTGEVDFRAFLVRVDADYAAGKFSRRDEYQGARTLANVRDHILRHRREGFLSAEKAREEWGLLDQMNDLDSPFEFGLWVRETSIDDAHEFAVYDYPGGARAFCERALPRFQKVLREELARASSPEVVRG